MTTWNYRLIKHDEDDPIWYGLHEVYYDENGDIWSWTEYAFLISDTPEEMFKILKMIKHDLKKHDVLSFEEIS